MALASPRAAVASCVLAERNVGDGRDRQDGKSAGTTSLTNVRGAMCDAAGTGSCAFIRKEESHDLVPGLNQRDGLDEVDVPLGGQCDGLVVRFRARLVDTVLTQRVDFMSEAREVRSPSSAAPVAPRERRSASRRAQHRLQAASAWRRADVIQRTDVVLVGGQSPTRVDRSVERALELVVGERGSSLTTGSGISDELLHLIGGEENLALLLRKRIQVDGLRLSGSSVAR
jgi:hypothetical protein